jgi:alpha-beta hydrolase superfamily lysophospholipase
MGGLIVSHYVQNKVSREHYPEKVFLSSPAAGASGIMGPIFANSPKILMQTLTKLPTMPLSGVLDLKKLSHDGRVYSSYIKDEFTQTKIHTKLYMEILNASRDVFSRPLRVDCPLFCSVASEDALVNSKITIKYFTEIEKSGQLKIFEGGYHELHNEIEKYRKPYLNFLRQSLTGLSFE